MSTEATDSRTVVDGLHFPECLRWYEDRLYFCDMHGDAVYAFDPASGELATVAEVFHPGGIGWLPDGRLLVVASEDRRIMDGDDVYVDLTEPAPGWVNDILIDRMGRIFVGNFGYDLFSEEHRPTRLIVVDPDRRATVQAHDLEFPNGMVKRSDGTLVVAETFGNRLATFAVADDGSLRHTGTIALGDITPDGICIDAEDHVWVSTVGTAEVVRVSPDGDLERRAVSQPSFACMLGGEDGRTLFVATAPDYQYDARRAAVEGRIEALQVEVPGVGGQGLGA
jgi:sugar lactone lactonase YvrE